MTELLQRLGSNTDTPSHPHFLDALGAHEYGTTAPTSPTRAICPTCLVVLVAGLVARLMLLVGLGTCGGFGFLSRLGASVCVCLGVLGF